MSRHTRKVQMLLQAAKLYHGALDGLPGPQTDMAIERLDDEAVHALRGSRRIHAAGQAVLNGLGYEAGAVDGYWGHNTENAFLAWLQKTQTGQPLTLPREPEGDTPFAARRFPLQRDCAAFYGQPGKGDSEVARQLVRVPTYPMRIDWNLRQTVTAISLHRACAASAETAFVEIEKHYGLARLQELGLDRFAGSYNPRKMRGGSSWSMHAYGCAIDFYAQPNGLTARCPDALFCRPEYEPFFDIWERHGWVSLGRAIGRDWMHVQAARLK